MCSFSRLVANVFLVLAVLCVLGSTHQKRAPSMRGMSNRYIAQILDRVPAYSRHNIYRRFDYSNIANQMQEPELELKKRNNAEVVNHILKNFGTLDRLGDVGRK